MGAVQAGWELCRQDGSCAAVQAAVRRQDGAGSGCRSVLSPSPWGPALPGDGSPALPLPPTETCPQRGGDPLLRPASPPRTSACRTPACATPHPKAQRGAPQSAG